MLSKLSIKALNPRLTPPCTRMAYLGNCNDHQFQRYGIGAHAGATRLPQDKAAHKLVARH